MNERDQRIRLGLFVFGALVALGTLIILFGKRPDLLKDRDRFLVRFENAPNMQPGTPVRRSGVKIGEVSKVELEETGKVRVEIAVDRRYPPRRNERATISTSLLSGDATIDFVTDPRLTDIREVRPEETIPDPDNPERGPLAGQGPIDPSQAVRGAQDLGKSAQQTLEEIRRSIDQFTRVAPEVDRTLKEYTLLSQTIRQAIPEIQQTNDSVRRLADSVRGNIPDVGETNEKAQLAIDNWNKAGERLNVLLLANEQRVNKAIEELTSAATRANKLLGDENQKLFTDLLRNANSLLGEENQTNINSVLKNASKFVTEENAQNLTDTLRNVRSASENLDGLLKEGPKTLQQLNQTLSKADEAIENVRKFSAGFGDGGDFARNLTYTSGQIGLLIKDVRDLLQGYSQADGTIQRLLTDPSLYQQANNAVCVLARLLPKIEYILEDLKDFSDKIARHPNTLIFDKNASGGLKGSPFAPTAPSIGTRLQHGPAMTPPITVPHR